MKGHELAKPLDPHALGRRHLSLGFLTLAVFTALGLVLEAFHGLKLGFYLDAGNEARRLGFRLCHAHGALLGLVHVAWSSVLEREPAPRPRVTRTVSRLLDGSTLLLPGGFLLGALFPHGGDPGIGVLLVPVGAAFLLTALVLTARELERSRRERFVLREVAFGTPEYDAGVALRYRVLRAPIGLRIGADERREEADLVHLGLFEYGRLLGCLMLMDAGEGRVRMRQVAIAPERSRQGLGTRLVEFSEQKARELGFRWMILHARVSAVAFYERLGYEAFGEPFEEVTIPHRHMRKPLRPSDVAAAK